MDKEETVKFLNQLLYDIQFETIGRMKSYLMEHYRQEWDSNEVMRKWIAEA